MEQIRFPVELLSGVSRREIVRTYPPVEQVMQRLNLGNVPAIKPLVPQGQRDRSPPGKKVVPMGSRPISPKPVPIPEPVVAEVSPKVAAKPIAQRLSLKKKNPVEMEESKKSEKIPSISPVKERPPSPVKEKPASPKKESKKSGSPKLMSTEQIQAQYARDNIDRSMLIDKKAGGKTKSYTVDELKNHARNIGISTTGQKGELVQKINDRLKILNVE